MKKILLVTSARTGAGHRSISDALAEQFSGMDDVELRIIDGFELAGRAGVLTAGLYGVVTRHAPALYNAGWQFSMRHPPRFTVSALLCRRRFTRILRDFQPDLILTVHSLFNTVLTRMLDQAGEKEGKIPVVVLQADLVNIHSTWCNPRAAMTICPTREAYDASLGQGMPPERLIRMSLPVRARFCEAARTADETEYDPSRPPRVLLMSGGEGSGSIAAAAESILEHTDAELTVVCGRNAHLRDQLHEHLEPRYGDRVTVRGFVSDLEREMLRADLLVTRGSPNTMYEAAVMAIPFIVPAPSATRALAQEKGNPYLMQKNNLGIVLRSTDELPGVLRSLLENDAARLREIRAAQRAWRSFDSAREIAGYVASLVPGQGGLRPGASGGAPLRREK